MEGMEPSYRRHEKAMKAMCKNCKSTAHSTLQHGKHYKSFHEEKKAERMAKHMKAFEQGPLDNDKGVKEGSKADLKRDAREKKHMKGLPKTFGGKSTKPGMGGRAAILKSEGVPGGVIGNIARSKGEAPGQKGFHHGKHKKGMSEADMGDMSHYDPNLKVGKAGMKPAPSHIMGNVRGGKMAKKA
jgi:hypothetical protein